MKKCILDYIICECLIGLIAGTAGFILWAGRNSLKFFLDDFAVLGFIVLFLLFYGGGTVIVLAVLDRAIPLREGDYTTEDFQFTLWKVQHVVEELGKLSLWIFFPVFFRQIFYSLFGAKVGKNVVVAGKILDPQLTTLEDGCVLGEGSILTSHVMTQNRFILRRIQVGSGATVGIGTILLPGVKIGEGAVILPGSVIRANTQVPRGEVWGGAPAILIKKNNPCSFLPENTRDQA